MKGKAIAVTGGFGALGRIVAEAAANRGALVAALDVATTPPDGLAERLGANALLLGGVDLSSADGARKAIADLIAKFGRLDALINIAGGFLWGTAEGGDPTNWDRLYAMNLKTALHASIAATPHLLESRAGRIINIRRQRRSEGGCRNGGLCRQQSGGASTDRKLGGRIEEQRRHRKRGVALDHRHARQQAAMPNAAFDRWVLRPISPRRDFWAFPLTQPKPSLAR